ncbi:protocatechuate 4,5-dioxygenase [Klebsiella pneumoniae subsp. pneumoniae]|uniref:Protocatechuate 4,5-dioxygenase n=1 Tax=Klebsiella pneumoniae subsp. pneumoniae TaxID=72407 RepID=A0A377YYB9_KLEPN|nr:protocatechuate 4,5-dioxygenase [Klebsiella pneumoniae subsp. pneumoniae]
MIMVAGDARRAISNVTETWRDYYLPSMTGIATLILENNARLPPVDTLTRHRQHMAQQLAGVGETAGNLSFYPRARLNGLRLNRFLHRLIEPAWRERFLQSPQSLYAEAGLSEEEQQLLNARDWRGLIQYGASFFLLEKMGAVVAYPTCIFTPRCAGRRWSVSANAQPAGNLFGGG